MQLPMVRWLSGRGKTLASRRGGRWCRRRGRRAAGHRREAVGGGVWTRQRPEQSVIIEAPASTGDGEWSSASFLET
jgi:hypothetical protein